MVSVDTSRTDRGWKLGYEGEVYAQVQHISNSGNAFAVGTESEFDGEVMLLGKLNASVGERVPVLPFADDLTVSYLSETARISICTDRAYWKASYIDYLSSRVKKTVRSCRENVKASLQQVKRDVRNMKTSLIQQESISVSFELFSTAVGDGSQLYVGISDDGGPLPHPRYAANEFESAPDTGTMVDGVVNRRTRHGTIITIDAEEYVLQDSTDAEPGDTISVRLVNDSVVTAEQRDNTAAKSREADENGISDIDDREIERIKTETPSYTETRRRIRDQAFATKVKDAYNEQCVICGERRETPDRNAEVEAAHIFPKREGGVDHVQNGVALCKLHHWAFDNGWFSFTNDYEIIVRNTPEYDGYDEFVKFDGETLHLPDSEKLYPHPKFIREHRELHGFDN